MTVEKLLPVRISGGELDGGSGDAIPRLTLRNICKAYGLLKANDGVSLTVGAGEIHAVLGENGAGKSTLMKIIYGLVQPDEGDIFWEGRAVRIASPVAARSMGIGMVFQHFALFETLTVGQNIALAMGGNEPLDSWMKRIAAVSSRYGLQVDPRRYVHDLAVGERQRVEIVRCLLQDPRLLIMDEPTSVLTPHAVLQLFEVLRLLAEEGTSVLYISHKLDEIRALCSSATVMRAGRVVARVDPRAETAASLAQRMVGRSMPEYARRTSAPGPEMLRVTDLTIASTDPFGTSLRRVNFQLYAGEIFGIAGVAGNGQAELLAALSGETLQRGTVQDAIVFCGQPVAHLDAARRRAMGFGFVPEERLGRGAVPEMDLQDNGLLTASRHRMVRRGWLRRGAMRGFAERCIAEFDVRCNGTTSLAQSLSGGNLQKFIVGRELLQRPRVLVVAQPTWGVDIGAAIFIRQQLLDLAAAGTAILLISEELEELFAISDRLAVLVAGELSASVRTDQTDMQAIGLAMAGSLQAEAA
jgi:ABC-type uncharacterized transport system ATPase subunit